MIDIRHKWNTRSGSLIWGLILSIVLTLIAYFSAQDTTYHKAAYSGFVLGVGILQALLQLFLFMHVGIETKPHWNLIMFLFMVLVTIVIVGGSIWIMNNLDYNVMPDMKQ
jgi:cytochrome o ubiquinol oxidase operon protein cyoD